MRAEALTLLAGAAVAALLLGGRSALLPEPPSRASVPRAESLEELSLFLAVDTARWLPASGESTRLARDPFGGAGSGGGPGAGESTREPAEGRPGTPRARWSVSAIMISEDRRVAIIDDRLVEAGDALEGGGRLVSVGRDHVVVAGPDGIRRRIALNQ